MNRTLHSHQELAIGMLRQSLASGSKRPVLQAPTGAGKTILAAAIIEMALAKGKRILFCVPQLSLIDQTVERLGEEGVHQVGVIQAQHPGTDASQPVQVCSLQTLKNRKLPQADLVIVDECHVMFDFYARWMEMEEWKSVPFIGLTATPWTRGLGKIYDDLLIPTTTEELISKRFLSPFIVYAPSHPDLRGVRIVAGDYHEGQLSSVMSEAKLTADIVKTWLEKGEDRPTLAFCVDLAHARKLRDQFEAAGVSCGYVDAFTTRLERAEIAEKFRARLYQVVCSVGTLTTGIDWDVRCIIFARPTKSIIRYVQCIGRGLRTAVGKTECLARGTRILTNCGEVNIEDITLDHKVWDGVSFVSHSGAVCKGVRTVISHDGITATPNHEVMTDEGWKSISEAHRRKIRIVRSALGRVPLRIPDDQFFKGGRKRVAASSRSEMRALWAGAYGSLSQYSETASDNGLSALQWKKTCGSSFMALSALSGATRSLLQSASDFIRKIWRARHTIPIFRSQRGSQVGGRKSRNCRSIFNLGSYRQQWPLRAGEYAVGPSGSSGKQYTEIQRIEQGAVSTVSATVSRSEVCGQNAISSFANYVGFRNCREMGNAVLQAEREVWDILNSGPLQRFTANGRLVHNCLILDHSDTTLRLGFVDDIHHESLDDGSARQSGTCQKEKEEPKPKECPACHVLKAPKIHVCPHCGFAPAKQPNVVTRDGELVELRRGKVDIGTKQEVYSGLLWIASARGYKDGWVANQYRQAFGVWPARLVERPAVPSNQLQAWVTSQQIRYWKGKGSNHAAAN